MKFISCASYYGTGSSAVTDFVSEFDNVFSFTNEEFRFIQDPDGISDLEFNLVECFNRHNSGHALKRYKKLVDFYTGNFLGGKYSNFFGSKWKELSYRYIDELTDFKYNGWWQYDLYDNGSFFYFRKRIINKLLHTTIWLNKPEKNFNSLKKEITYASHPTQDKFLKVTRRYIRDLFTSVIPKGYDTIMVDQLLPPMNLNRYLRYFDNDIQVVVVDRDPRDIFVLSKYYWKDGIVPKDAKTFCKWFKYTRSHRKFELMDSPQVKFIQFEDMIYNYDETMNSLQEWLGLNRDAHIDKFKFFDPKKSIENTQVWKNKPEAKEEVAYISASLREYLYNKF